MRKILTNSYAQTGRLVRLDGDQIVGDDGHAVAVYAEHKSRACGTVDEPYEVLLAWRELDVRVAPRPRGRVMALAVDDDAVGPGEVGRRLLQLVLDEGRLVDVVLDEDGAHIDVPVGARGSVDDEWSDGSLMYC